jgi:transcriptional regulator with XRE-family HTH domain
MASHKLPNYIRHHRKRLGLSQEEVAFLLGWNGSAQTSRYEHFCRIPTLQTALALSHIFQTSIYELFSGEKDVGWMRRSHRRLRGNRFLTRLTAIKSQC